jgi:hypothetical protein
VHFTSTPQAITALRALLRGPEAVTQADTG